MADIMYLEYKDIVLRDTTSEDVDTYLRWMTSGEWRYYDAPWEGIYDSLSPEKEAEWRELFQKIGTNPLPEPRHRLTITLTDGTPIGRVTRYGSERLDSVWYLGIDICEDAQLNKGLGTQAMMAWTNYLFENSGIHKLEIHTWTINLRMMRVAEKLGYTFEGREREIRQWEGEWIDMVRYGMLRGEWNKI